MSNNNLRQAVEQIAAHLQQPAGLSVQDASALCQLMTSLPAALHQAAQANTDPRYAVRLASSTESAGDHIARLKILCAHLAERHALHCLDPRELDVLRDHCDSPDTATDEASPAAPDSADVAARYALGRPTFKDPAEFLAGWLPLDYHEAKRRVNAARQLIGRFDDAGVPVDPQFPKLAAKFNDASVPPQPVISAAGRLATLEPVAEGTEQPLPPVLTPEGATVEDIAQNLVAEPNPATRSKKLNQLFKQARATTEQLDPVTATGLFRTGAKNGLVNYALRLLPGDAELIESLIAQADNPRTHAGNDSRVLDDPAEAGAPSGSAPAPDAEDRPDFVTAEEAAQSGPISAVAANVPQRRLKALLGFLRLDIDKILRDHSRRQRKAKGKAQKRAALPPLVRPLVMVHLTLAELRGEAKTHGLTAHGLELSATYLRRILARARIIPMTLGGKGEILDVGRSQREYPLPMARAIKARDRGCIVPGCKVPVEHCEIHHIRFWKDGGVTAVRWAATMCTKHHHDVHAGLLKVISNGGVPQVILPKFQDPLQLPRRNSINYRLGDLFRPADPVAPPP